MAICINDILKKSHLVVWKLDEDLSYYQSKVKLSADEEFQLDNIKSERRRKEFLCSRMIIQNVCRCNKKLTYHKDGRPYLSSSSKHISISHSKTHLGVLISEQGKPGLDIEQVSSRTGKIYDKFVGEQEQSYVKRSDQASTTLLWSAKEAVFKMICEQGIDFKKDIRVKSFELKGNGSLYGIYAPAGTEIKLNFRFIGDNVIVWGFDV